MSKTGLSDAEWKLMTQLWESPYLTIRNLTLALEEHTGWEKHTVITMLNRLEKKGAVSYRQNGRAKEYYPLISREETSAKETESFLDKVYQGSLSLMVNAMVERDSLSEEEMQALRKLLRGAEK